MGKTIPFRVPSPDQFIGHQRMRQTPSGRKPVNNISDNMRLMMLLMITHYGLSCYMAAKVLKMPYENAKMIYRCFRNENRVIWNLYNPTGSEFQQNRSYVMMTRLVHLKVETKHRLCQALASEEVFTLN